MSYTVFPQVRHCWDMFMAWLSVVNTNSFFIRCIKTLFLIAHEQNISTEDMKPWKIVRSHHSRKTSNRFLLYSRITFVVIRKKWRRKNLKIWLFSKRKLCVLHFTIIEASFSFRQGNSMKILTMRLNHGLYACRKIISLIIIYFEMINVNKFHLTI